MRRAGRRKGGLFHGLKEKQEVLSSPEGPLGLWWEGRSKKVISFVVGVEGVAMVVRWRWAREPADVRKCEGEGSNGSSRSGEMMWALMLSVLEFQRNRVTRAAIYTLSTLLSSITLVADTAGSAAHWGSIHTVLNDRIAERSQ